MPLAERAAAVLEARQPKIELISRLTARRTPRDATVRLDGLPPNVLGVGYGLRHALDGLAPADIVLRVYVETKRPKAQLSLNEIVPPAVNGIPTDVIPIGSIRVLSRPTLCGVSCSHRTAREPGTLGCLVQKSGAGIPINYILSNNHVLANVNGAAIGDTIVHPGSGDGIPMPIARLSEFEPILFRGSNRIDAAIAQVIHPGSVLPEIADIGLVEPAPAQPVLGQRVSKRGRTTGLTHGIVVDVAADIRVRYGTGTASFIDQTGVDGLDGEFAADGDSGSLLVQAPTRRPVGLLFAGGAETAFANPIDLVLARFAVHIAR